MVLDDFTAQIPQILDEPYTFESDDPVAAEAEEVVRTPSIQMEDSDGGDGVSDVRYGRFVIEPLQTGFGYTVANPIRRVLYNGLEGAAVTSVRIEGVQHEYQTIPNIKEQVTEILLNVKALRLRSDQDMPGKLRLDVAGAGKVTAADIMLSANFEVVNPELVIATLEDDAAKLSLELNVELGKGYREAGVSEGMQIGVLPVDAVFTPIRKVSYSVVPTRVGRETNYEKLTMEVWTDGSVSPADAMKNAAGILVGQFGLFANFQRDGENGADGEDSSAVRIPPEHYTYQIEGLYLSARTLNCLKRAGVDTVGAVLEMSREDLLKIRNFGEKSYTELFDTLREKDLLPPGLDPALQNGAPDDGGDEETE